MQSDYLFTPRDYKSIELFSNTTEQEWNDPNWQLKNSIKDVDTLSRVISLNEHQKNSIRNTLDEMKKQGKEPMRITPYYSTLMPDNPFSQNIQMVLHLKTWLTLYSGKAYPLLHIYYSHKPEWNSQWLNQKEPMVHFINDIQTAELSLCVKTPVVQHFVRTVKGQNLWIKPMR